MKISVLTLLPLISQINAFTPSQLDHGKTLPSTLSSTRLDGIGSTISRVKDSLTSKERSRKDLKIGIAGFYDRSSQLWEEVWGEHMHHGYYVPEDRTDHVQAQIDLIDEVLKWSGVPEPSADGGKVPTSVVDVGCGIGGSSRHIASKYGCTAQGITLSPYQAGRGNELAKEQGLADSTNFQVSGDFVACCKARDASSALLIY